MSEFERYEKYLVLKRSDIDAALSRSMKGTLSDICNMVDKYREKRSKESHRYVVVSDSMPELYEQTFQAIEEYVTGKPQEIAELEAEHRKIRALVDEQAEDEGLWFQATTVTEAYLQQELRRLHGVIEDEGSSGKIMEQGND